MLSTSELDEVESESDVAESEFEANRALELLPMLGVFVGSSWGVLNGSGFG